MVAVFCRDLSDSPGLSPAPDDEKSPEGTNPGNDADGTVPWQQTPIVHKRKGQKNKKKKSEGAFCFLFFDTGPLTYLQAWNKDSPHVIFSLFVFFFLYLLNNGSSSHLDVLEVKTRTRSDSG